jgi:hypothetical protein
MKNYYGVVESRADPKQLGRVRVRVLGIHTEDKVQLPTADLPWATVLSHDGANSGLGTTPSFFVEGTWVLVGFFDDHMQEPYIIGGLPGIPSTKSSNYATEGFTDPNNTYPVAINVSDVHENARGSITALSPAARDSIRKVSIPSADFDGFEIATVGSNLAVAQSNGGTFDEPLVVNGTYKPTYPNNHVYNTESGHLLEFDDTTDQKRIAITHSAGSYQEYSNDGTYVSHVVSKMFEIVSSDKSSLCEGDVIETIDKSLKLKVNRLGASGNNYDIEIGENANFNIMVRSGALNMNVNGNVNIFSNDDINMSCDNFRVDASNKVTISSGDKILIDSGGEVDIDGTPINLN